MDAPIPTGGVEDRPYRRAYNDRFNCGALNEYCWLGKFSCK
jgi:hypothetical protein